MGDHGFDRAAARALGVLVGSDQPVLREKVGVGVDFVNCQIPKKEEEKKEEKKIQKPIFSS